MITLRQLNYNLSNRLNVRADRFGSFERNLVDSLHLSLGVRKPTSSSSACDASIFSPACKSRRRRGYYVWEFRELRRPGPGRLKKAAMRNSRKKLLCASRPSRPFLPPCLQSLDGVVFRPFFCPSSSLPPPLRADVTAVHKNRR